MVSETIVKEQSDVSYIRMDQVIVDERQYKYVRNILGEKVYSELSWIYTRHKHDIPRLNSVGSGLVNAYRINDIPQVNKFMEKANRGLDYGQYFVICMETKNSRKQRILNKFPRIFSLPWYCIDFIGTRILPKLKSTRELYSKLTKGRNRVISLSEGLARLICCGFEIVGYRNNGGLTCIISRKVKEPEYDRRPTEGAVIRLNRIGKGGKIIQVRKLRTMHPYSEYLQRFIFDNNDLKEGGKFNSDFRLTNWGRVFRRYWLDELPMLINWCLGDLKLVGVRPLSRQYFELYPEDLKETRTRVKPGLIPPYYADMPKDLEEIHESERRYLAAYNKNPFKTDVRYLSKAFVNIVFKSARSQ